jgi:putative DNA primase/helicase
MTEAAAMFDPLSTEELPTGPTAKAPIVPVPPDAPPIDYRHREHGEPSREWPYHNAGGLVVGYVLRWDFVGLEGEPDKAILPACYCDLRDGRRAWRSVGMPTPRPLYRLLDILARPDARVLVVEGEKAADAATKLFPDLVATTTAGGTNAPHLTDLRHLKGRQVVVWPDNDEAGSEYAEAVARLCTDSEAASVAIVTVPPDSPSKWDLTDTLPKGWTLERLRGLLDNARPVEPEDSRRLLAVNIGDFLSMDIPPREMVLAPVLPSQGLALLYAARGVGKTFVGLGIAYAVATGGKFLCWQAPAPRKVLHVDGEMPARAMQERLAQIVQSAEKEPPSTDYLRIVTPDLQEDGIPDISSTEGQAAIEAYLEGVSLVIVDNLSTLCRYGRENEAESWEPMQQWMLSLRRRGFSVLLVHHAGKGGNQRGTSKREDCLDTVICLKRPPDYRAEDGARFEVHLEKARSVIGQDAKPFEARLEVRDIAAVWTTRNIEDRELEQVIELSREGESVRDIAEATGISKSKVNRLQKRARAEGRLP